MVCWEFFGNLVLHADSLPWMILSHCAPGTPGSWPRGAGVNIWIIARSVAGAEICVLATSCNSFQFPCNSCGSHRPLKSILPVAGCQVFVVGGEQKQYWHHSLEY